MDYAARQRLTQAQQLQKYGALHTWKELYLYQLWAMHKNPPQAKEIAAYARRNNRGETIVLPLMHGQQQTFQV